MKILQPQITEKAIERIYNYRGDSCKIEIDYNDGEKKILDNIDGHIVFRNPSTEFGHWGFVIKGNGQGLAVLVKVEDKVNFELYDQNLKANINENDQISEIRISFFGESLFNDGESNDRIIINDKQGLLINNNKIELDLSKPIQQSVAEKEYDGWDLNSKDIKNSCEWISGFIRREVGDNSLEIAENNALSRQDAGEYFSHIYSCIAYFQDTIEERKDNIDNELYRCVQLWVIGILNFIKNENGDYPKLNGSGFDVWMRAASAFSRMGNHLDAIDRLKEGLDIYIEADKWEMGILSEMDKLFNSDPAKPEIMMAHLCKYYYLADEYQKCVEIGSIMLESIGIRGHNDYSVKNFPNGVRYYVENSKKELPLADRLKKIID